MKNNAEMSVTIKVDLPIEPGREHASGQTKMEAISRIDELLDRELAAPQTLEVDDGTLAVPPLGMTKRNYSQDSRSVTVKVYFDPRKVPDAVRDHVESDYRRMENHWFMRLVDRILRAISPNAEVAISETRQEALQEDALEITREIVRRGFVTCMEVANKPIPGLARR